MEMEDKHTKMQANYIEARVAGNSPPKSKEIAGYSPSLAVSRIETPKVHSAIITALNKQGLTDKWLAKEIKKGAKKAWDEGSVVGTDKESGKPIYAPNFLAHSRYLDKVSDMRGYGKPGVAVQVNNTQVNNAASELGLDQLDAREVAGFINAVRDALHKAESSGVYEAEVVPEDVQTHPGVVQPPPQI